MQPQQMYDQMPGYAPAMQYVGVGPRFLALLIDGIIVGVVAGIINVAAGSGGDPSRIVVSGSITGILAILYFIVMEATMGATVGKLVMGLRVVRDNGAPISWGESIVRNLLRIVDGLFAYLVGAIIIWNTARRKRLGDLAAHTVVVKKNR
jgi:uncharacterized RDD family membrane protein YckC